MASHMELIREYYTRIDANDTEWVLAIFSPDAIYERAGVVYQGMAQMRQFFCTQRQIRGIHSIQHLWPIESNIVTTLGQFEGHTYVEA